MKKAGKISFLLAGAMILSVLGGCGKKSSDPAEAMKDKYSQYVTLGEYKGVSYTPAHTEVTDEDIQYDIDSLISQGTTTEDLTEGTATMGDAVNIDYVGSIDGVEFDGGSTGGAGTQITLGQSGYIDDFDEQIAGHKVGETFDVNVTFPEDYGKDELNGKDAVFVTTLNSIVVTHTPEYTDEYVASQTDYETMADYEQAMREKHEEENKQADESTDKETVLQAVIDQSTISQYPEQEMKDMVDDTVSQIREAAEANNIDASTYIMYWYGFASEDEFIAEIEDSVKAYIEEKMIVAAVAKAENITVTKEEADAQKQMVMESYGYTDDSQLEGAFKEEDFYYYALAEKVVDFLMENANPGATPTDAAPEEAE